MESEIMFVMRLSLNAYYNYRRFKQMRNMGKASAVEIIERAWDWKDRELDLPQSIVVLF